MSGSADSSHATVAVEAPLEVRVAGRPLAVTLRTPGHDVELAMGFLLGEGVIETRGDIAGWRHINGQTDAEAGSKGSGPGDTAVVEIELEEPALERWARRRVQREFRSNSACGACGKPSLDDLYIRPLHAADRRPEANTEQGPIVGLESFGGLIERAAKDQHLFQLTGGVHGAAAFDKDGNCLAVFEDVGRHNAVDKLVGWALLGRPDHRVAGRGTPSSAETGRDALLDDLLVLSTGRAGFEIVQKVLRARGHCLVALGAATDWAVELAREGGLALVGFGGGDPIRYCDAGDLQEARAHI